MNIDSCEKYINDILMIIIIYIILTNIQHIEQCQYLYPQKLFVLGMDGW